MGRGDRRNSIKMRRHRSRQKKKSRGRRRRGTSGKGFSSDPIASDGRPALSARLPFYYGWVMLPVALAATVAATPGQTIGIAAYNESIRADLGLSLGELAGIYMIATFLAAPSNLVPARAAPSGLRETAGGARCRQAGPS